MKKVMKKVMRKITRAYQLESIQDQDVYAVNIKGVWYPCEVDTKELFIYGQGHKKLTKTQKNKIEKVGKLPINWTAENVKAIGDKYGYNVACGMIQGWGNCSLFSDGSIGLSYAKHEIINMIKYGKVYDDYSDYLHTLTVDFVKVIREKDFYLAGECLYYKKEFIDFVGLYNSIPFFPSLYVEHTIMGRMHITPMFDPIGFDDLLSLLISYLEPKDEEGHPTYEIRDKVVSVKDRIAYLVGDAIAERFDTIFVMQKLFSKKTKLSK